MELHFSWVVGCHGNGLTQFWEHLCTPTRIPQGMLTNFGKFTKCSRCGAIISPLNSSQDGRIAWMRACLCGQTSSCVLDLCFHKNQGHLVTNTTLCAVAQVVSCGLLNWWRVRIILLKLDDNNLMSLGALLGVALTSNPNFLQGLPCCSWQWFLCVKRIVELRKKGVFASALIKK